MTLLCDIAEIRAGYPFRGAVPDMPDGLCQVIQPKDVFGGGIIDEVALCFTPERLKPDYLLKNGQILLSSRGEFKAALLKGKENPLPRICFSFFPSGKKSFCRSILFSI